MHSQLTLTTQVRNGRTSLKNTFVSPPLKLLALPPQADGMLRAVQMSSSPGLLSGDVIQTRIELAEHAALSLYTQAFTRVLSMNEGGQAQQITQITQAAHSRLCFLPHPLVLHQGSTLLQTTDIHLDDNCELLYGEIIAAGRILHGEKFSFCRLSSHLNIYHHNKELITDNIQWQPQHMPVDVIGQMEHYTHQLNLFYVHTAQTAAEIRATVERLFEELDAQYPESAQLLWGISQANDQVLCIRALADNAQTLQNLLKSAVFLLQEQQNSPLTAAFFK